MASVIFLNYFVASFLLCCPCEALEGPISTGVGIILTTTFIQSRHIIIRIALLYIYIYIYNIVVLVKMCRFWINVVKFYLRKPLLRWTFQHFAMAAEKKGGNGTNKKTGTRWESNTGLGYSRAARLPQCHGCRDITWVFILLSFPVLKFTPPPSIRVDFCSRHVVNSVFS